jgi:hypothetical protein
MKVDWKEVEALGNGGSEALASILFFGYAANESH